MLAFVTFFRFLHILINLSQFYQIVLLNRSAFTKFIGKSATAAFGGCGRCSVAFVTGYDYLLKSYASGEVQAKRKLLRAVSLATLGRSDTVSYVATFS